jgi:NitT/TauT family transport system ATP-binding protein
MSGYVDVTDVQLTYGGSAGKGGGTLAVDGLTMSVRQGEFAAVVGPSGCGKSTLMKLMTGLVRPQTGNVVVAGQPVTGPVSMAGMAFQNPSLLPWRTTLRNVMLPLEIVQPHRGKLRSQRAAYTEKAEGLLSLVGLKGFGAKYPWQLSGGMQQRSNLCRALIHDPVLLMLDEPFGALDAFTREELWQVMRDLHAEKKMTVILVTHDLREAVYLADRIFVMSARPGRIIAERRIDFPRPRPIDVTYTGEFNAIVHELRGQISQARSAAA